MSERKINLEEILNKHLASRTSLEVDYDDYIFIKRAMLEVCLQTLKLAAENAKAYEYGAVIGVDEQSILDTINQIE